jgi:hypothetical protein
MSIYHDTYATYEVMNVELKRRIEMGDPIKLEPRGQPKLHVLSFTPLAYETYGRVFNKPPEVYGSLPLRAFLVQQHPLEDSVITYAGLQYKDNRGYGFVLDGNVRKDMQIISSVAAQLGIPVTQTRGA